MVHFIRRPSKKSYRYDAKSEYGENTIHLQWFNRQGKKFERLLADAVHPNGRGGIVKKILIVF